ncbi:ATP-binding protein [Chondromyces apiculatus]|uniref:AAA+ ATPase domain-containing protein n=1 Tax=Chondromyces apiculatus DSM 436 TaxID=1192034 RepID=A0A017TIL8_9BACT|nr:AAA family ATPase [Chondromyces apiculatus]EYF08695.1 Hypothetical protein CAP_2556 [Chondromyces apiculatus DSM 436]
MGHSKAFDGPDAMAAPSSRETWRGPPSATASWRVERSSFVGRADSIQQLQEYLEDGARLLTILGAPGLGKTRLLRRLGGMLADEGASVCFCDLTAATTLSGLLGVVARELGVPLTSGATDDDESIQLGRALAARGPSVLLLDNFEQVVAHAEATVGRWLPMAPLAILVVTSRETLKLDEEVCFELQPLALAEGVRLFEDRARLVRPDLVLAGEERQAVVRIVEKLEGIPLAIELAAARVVILLPSEIDARLGSPLGLLRMRRRGAPERHLALERAIDGSFDLLTPWEKAAFAQASIFRGGFSLEAAEAVLDLTPYPGAPPVLDVLEALCQKSLVRRYLPPGKSSRTRFGLFESLRVYADGKLEEGSRREAEARHGRHFVEAAETWAQMASGSAYTVGLERLSLESSNILQIVHRHAEEPALTFRAALALDALLARVGPLQTRLSVLEQVSAGEQTATPAQVLRYLRIRAEAEWMSYRFPEARLDLERALALAQQEGDPRAETATLVALGDLSVYQTDAQTLGVHYRQADAVARRHGDRAAQAEVLSGPDDEELDAVEVQALVEELKDARSRAIALRSLTIRRMVRGRLERSLEAAEMARVAARSTGDPMLEATMASLALMLDLFLGRTQDARELAEASDRLRAMGGGFSHEVALFHLAGFFHGRGELEKVREILDELVSVFASRDYPSARWMLAAYRGALDAEEGRLELAEARFAEACSDAKAEMHPTAYVKIHLLEGFLDLARAHRCAADGRHEEARAHRVAACRRLASLGELLVGVTRLGALTVAPALERAIAAYDAGVFASCPSTPQGGRGSERAPSTPEPDLELDANGRWFRLRKGKRVSLHRRHVMSGILARLAERHATAPGQPSTVAELVEAGWPGERILPSAAANRLHNAVAVLRGLGLRGALCTRDGGYLLDPDIVVHRHHDPPPAKG